jgi:hypothetical protein
MNHPLCLPFCNECVYGQYNTTIRWARPGQSFGPFTTGKNILQIQTGITYDSFENKDMLYS